MWTLYWIHCLKYVCSAISIFKHWECPNDDKLSIHISDAYCIIVKINAKPEQSIPLVYKIHNNIAQTINFKQKKQPSVLICWLLLRMQSIASVPRFMTLCLTLLTICRCMQCFSSYSGISIVTGNTSDLEHYYEPPTTIKYNFNYVDNGTYFFFLRIINVDDNAINIAK